MNPLPDTAPQPALLILADISGYTRYMTANVKTLAHSQGIITELIQAIAREIKAPIEVAKLEGDAIFLFCPTKGNFLWTDTRREVGASLLAFFRLFGERLDELTRSSTCTCQACAHIEKLRLKVIVHSGEVLSHRVLNFVELAGVDVIIAHRLLKNSVNADQYLLMTEPARAEVEFPAEISFAPGSETYPDLGRVKTLVFFPDGEGTAAAVAEESVGGRFRRSWKLFCRLWFAPLTSRKANFHNLTTQSGAFAKFGYALAMVLLAPIFLPVGAVFSLLHSLKARKHHADCHEHKADGSCCRGKK